MTQPAAPVRSTHLEVAVVEDDVALREAILIPALTDYGFRVAGAGSAMELYRLLLDRHFDLVVLDLGLPDEDGISIAARLRQTGTMGLVMLTASRDRHDRIKALEESVDAFLTKPVDLDVLAATLHSLARRLQPPTAASAMPAAPPVACTWHLEANGWLLVAPNGTTVALTMPEQSILGLLEKNAGQATSREALIHTLTRNIYDFDPHRLETIIYRLRRKIEQETGAKSPVLTARGAGYVFTGRPAAT